MEGISPGDIHRTRGLFNARHLAAKTPSTFGDADLEAMLQGSLKRSKEQIAPRMRLVLDQLKSGNRSCKKLAEILEKKDDFNLQAFKDATSLLSQSSIVSQVGDSSISIIQQSIKHQIRETLLPSFSLLKNLINSNTPDAQKELKQYQLHLLKQLSSGRFKRDLQTKTVVKDAFSKLSLAVNARGVHQKQSYIREAIESLNKYHGSKLVYIQEFKDLLQDISNSVSITTETRSESGEMLDVLLDDDDTISLAHTSSETSLSSLSTISDRSVLSFDLQQIDQVTTFQSDIHRVFGSKSRALSKLCQSVEIYNKSYFRSNKDYLEATLNLIVDIESFQSEKPYERALVVNNLKEAVLANYCDVLSSMNYQSVGTMMDYKLFIGEQKETALSHLKQLSKPTLNRLLDTLEEKEVRDVFSYDKDVNSFSKTKGDFERCYRQIIIVDDAGKLQFSGQDHSKYEVLNAIVQKIESREARARFALLKDQVQREQAALFSEDGFVDYFFKKLGESSELNDVFLQLTPILKALNQEVATSPASRTNLDLMKVGFLDNVPVGLESKSAVIKLQFFESATRISAEQVCDLTVMDPSSGITESTKYAGLSVGNTFEIDHSGDLLSVDTSVSDLSRTETRLNESAEEQFSSYLTKRCDTSNKLKYAIDFRPRTRLFMGPTQSSRTFQKQVSEYLAASQNNAVDELSNLLELQDAIDEFKASATTKDKECARSLFSAVKNRIDELVDEFLARDLSSQEASDFLTSWKSSENSTLKRCLEKIPEFKQSSFINDLVTKSSSRFKQSFSMESVLENTQNLISLLEHVNTQPIDDVNVKIKEAAIHSLKHGLSNVIHTLEATIEKSTELEKSYSAMKGRLSCLDCLSVLSKSGVDISEFEHELDRVTNPHLLTINSALSNPKSAESNVFLTSIRVEENHDHIRDLVMYCKSQVLNEKISLKQAISFVNQLESSGQSDMNIMLLLESVINSQLSDSSQETFVRTSVNVLTSVADELSASSLKVISDMIIIVADNYLMDSFSTDDFKSCIETYSLLSFRVGESIKSGLHDDILISSFGHSEVDAAKSEPEKLQLLIGKLIENDDVLQAVFGGEIEFSGPFLLIYSLNSKLAFLSTDLAKYNQLASTYMSMAILEANRTDNEDLSPYRGGFQASQALINKDLLVFLDSIGSQSTGEKTLALTGFLEDKWTADFGSDELKSLFVQASLTLIGS